MHFKIAQKLSVWKVVKYTGLTTGVVIIVSILLIFFFPDIYINRYLKHRIINEFTAVCPGYSIGIADLNFNILRNRIEFDSIIIKSSDSTLFCSIDKSTIRDISWLRFIWKGDALADLITETEGISLKSRESQYEFRCERLFVSLPDSQMVAFDLKINPLVNDNKFFDESNYRKTRFRMGLPQIVVSGIDFGGLMKGKIYHTRFIQIHDVSFDILVNMYNPCKVDNSKSLMLNELFISIKEIIQLDSLKILSGHLKYGELYSAHSDPAVITFDNLHLLAEGISNNDGCGDTLAIQANAIFMKEGLMTLQMQVPLTSQKFSLQYTGSLGEINLDKLNSFLEIAEHTRIKSGIIHSAYYYINVEDGNASGSLRIKYDDFTLAFLDSHSGSEKAFMVSIKSLLANTFKLNGSNKKDEDGSLKLGTVNYSRKKDDVFTQFLWFSLRSGVADIGGF